MTLHIFRSTKLIVSFFELYGDIPLGKLIEDAKLVLPPPDDLSPQA
jgi:hypothetical protein